MLWQLNNKQKVQQELWREPIKHATSIYKLDQLKVMQL